MKRTLHAGKRFSGGFSLNTVTEDELYEIHLATIEVLEKTGVFVGDSEALEIFDGGGAVIDKKNKIVRIPSYLVEESIQSAPQKIILPGRNPKNDIVIENNRIAFANFSGNIRFVDPYTGEHRESTKADIAAITRVCDYLSDHDICMRGVHALDVPQEVGPLHHAEALLPNTTKHIILGSDNGRFLKKIIEIAEVIAGGKKKLRERPILSFISATSSPLKLTKDFCEAVIESARAGMPIVFATMAMAGASAPVTPASAIVIENAEHLASVVLSQLTQKGAPVILGSYTTCLDLKVGTAPLGAPERGMIGAAKSKLSRYYNLPDLSAGLTADSKTADGQATHEKTLTGLLLGLAGTNIITGMGGLESGITFDINQLVMDNEIARMIKYTVKGIAVTDETLAVDIINEMGPFNNFLSHENTLKYMRTQSQTKLIDRRIRDNWESAGGTTIYERASEEARYILENHKPDPLSDTVLKTIRSIVEETEAEERLNKAKN